VVPGKEKILLSFLRLSRAFSATLTGRFGMGTVRMAVEGRYREVDTEPAIALSVMCNLCSYHDVMVWGNLSKKPTPGQAAPGLEPGTSRM
jgi:hypothetical protein